MADTSPQAEATARLRVLRREMRAADKTLVARAALAQRSRSPLTRRPPPCPLPSRSGKFSTKENADARKALEAEGVEKSLCIKALKQLQPKK